MGKILDLLNDEWMRLKAPLDLEIEVIEKEEVQLKVTYSDLKRQKVARAKLFENEALGLEAGGKFAECDGKREERGKLELEIETLDEELVLKLQPLQQKCFQLEAERKGTPQKILGANYHKFRDECHKDLGRVVGLFEETLKDVQSFESLTNSQGSSEKYLDGLKIYDHAIFNETKKLWEHLRKWVGTPF